MTKSDRFEVVVVGAGHAGIEAALVSARMGHSVLLLTLSVDNIGQMSCNPSIGGLAKGHLVKEVDALGGEIGVLADKTAIQYRMLNRSKGPAVWSPRSQNDRIQYKTCARAVIEHTPNIDIKQEEATEIITEKNRVLGVRTAFNNEYYAKAVIVTTGTFLNGLMHIGLSNFHGGRLAEPAATRLTDSLKGVGINLGRLKTGTSPRVSTRSVDLTDLRMQHGDQTPEPLSFRTKKVIEVQIPCYITHTNEKTHEIILQNLDRSPLYSGKIKGIGPRYCPSIETKVERFADRDSHLVFIEPEGRDASEYYLNGLSTSLPYDVQVGILHSIAGLENAEITKPGYAVEYDFVYPIQLHPTLELKTIKSLYFAGQINGTSGYEEAAAQGIIAGLNASLRMHDENPFVLKRYEAYIGVLIDDLVTKNTLEPYRMFTSLAEHRLLLRIDNVADRLMHYGLKFGLIEPNDWQECVNEREEIDRKIEQMRQTVLSPAVANPILAKKSEAIIPEGRGGQSVFQILKRPQIHYEDIREMSDIALSPEIGRRVEIEVKYEGYIKREQQEIAKLRQLEKETIPRNFNYAGITGLSNEARTKLVSVRPINLDQASRIQGISPSDILLLLLHLKKSSGQKK
ncbi:tRNA uridine 5-carboxymethylaminomethyl modification protein [candidate division WOR_3 bacterium SM23_42]|uniref:tRNA uridine 5-carboxymethylaminomethyl modification enzyme MnmG n=1 Tax=candidate division WOR_3 bacterium SM23_42 TaxID=1703779 RepID=A0A0S8FTS1_UNCW3|nr:MAG: tRNA uridine 5-carboxymethylaminomethyl modification protein [candidate division WOR_3 bacterium SM23_42]